MYCSPASLVLVRMMLSGLGVSEERLGTAISPLGDDLLPPEIQSAEINAAIQKLRDEGKIQLWTKTGRIICAAGTPGAVLQVGGRDASGVTLYDLLKNTSLERDQVLDYTANGATRSLTASECRFGGHRVAGLRVHDADTDQLVDECLKPDGMLAGLRALRAAGRIDQVSLGMNMVVAPQILRLLREAPPGTFDNIMLAHGWNLLCQASYMSLEFRMHSQLAQQSPNSPCRTPVSFICPLHCPIILSLCCASPGRYGGGTGVLRPRD